MLCSMKYMYLASLIKIFILLGETVANAPLPRVSPFTTTTEEEINKQINRELFAHYTYLSMVSFYKSTFLLSGISFLTVL